MEQENEIQDIEIELLIQAIFARFQYDFRQYSRSSLRRRLQQAKVKFHCQSVSELQKKLFHEVDFFPKLLAYLTVNTTEMFRDPTYFNSLKENVIPYLKTFPSIKIWIAGCSTGEEIVSLAILLKEAQLKKYIIYATDINPMNLERARKGIYDPETIQKATRNYQLSGGATSLSDYYEAAYESVQIDPRLLHNVVFSDHSLATDNVFSEMHFISCRNVLIYFERPLQDRVFKLFSDSLVRGGYLGLGSKETLLFSEYAKDFEAIDSQNKIYQKEGPAMLTVDEMLTECENRQMKLVLIGTSAGGIEALKEILPSFRPPANLSVIVVIHLPPEGPNLLPGLFADQCSFGIKEAESNERLIPRTIYIAPPNYHLSVESDLTLSLSTEESVNYSRPSIDILFDSAAHALPHKTLAMLLTGANHDGAQGLKTLKQHGGLIIVQDPDSSEYPTMPESALKVISPDLIQNLEGLALFFERLSLLKGVS